MQENYIFIENQQYFDVPEDEDGLPKFYNQNPVFQEDLEIDEVQQVALNSFGIKYLYPWQRIVIANILDAVKAQEKTERRSYRCSEILAPAHCFRSLSFWNDPCVRY